MMKFMMQINLISSDIFRYLLIPSKTASKQQKSLINTFSTSFEPDTRR